MKKYLFLFFPIFLWSNFSFAEDGSALEGFDYMYGKIKGRAVVSGRWASFYITGEAAEAMYYQMSAQPQKDVGCSIGLTKTFDGLVCTQIRYLRNNSKGYECFLDVDLKRGKLNIHTETCPEESEYKKWDKKRNKRPRAPDGLGPDDYIGK